MKVQAINNNYSSNMHSTRTQNKNHSNPSFNAILSVHKDVFHTMALRTALEGKDSEPVMETLRDILIKVDDKVSPLLPNVGVRIGSTRKTLNEFMVYSQVPGAPEGFIMKNVFGDIDINNVDDTVNRIVSSTKNLLWSIDTLLKHGE